MKYVIFRDDDTNATTPKKCLELLYRPFLNQNLPINLAVIPNVNTDAKLPNGTKEYFIWEHKNEEQFLPINKNPSLVEYIINEPGYHIALHGYAHDYEEFLSINRQDIIFRLESGTKHLIDAGFNQPLVFIGPQDKLSYIAFEEVAKRFPIISTGWFERKRIPFSWWPQYIIKRLRKKQHWKIKNTLLLSRPKSYISKLYPPDSMLESVKKTIAEHKLTVLNTHWWEFFENGKPNVALIKALHSLADYFANEPNIKMLAFSDLLKPEYYFDDMCD